MAPNKHYKNRKLHWLNMFATRENITLWNNKFSNKI